MGGHNELPLEVKSHAARVADLARLAARATGKNERAAYLAGLFHDDGKADLPPELFDGHDISEAEYEAVKEHAAKGYAKLRSRMLFTGLCSGLHHRMSKDPGYGISIEDIPKEFSFSMLKKLLDISTIVAIADFIDAYKTRTTSISGDKSKSVSELLIQRYPDERVLIDTMLTLAEEFYKIPEKPRGEGVEHDRK